MTGKKRIIGGGCYIRPEKCATNLTLSPLFYDGEGGANYATGMTMACFLNKVVVLMFLNKAKSGKIKESLQ